MPWPLEPEERRPARAGTTEPLPPATLPLRLRLIKRRLIEASWLQTLGGRQIDLRLAQQQPPARTQRLPEPPDNGGGHFGFQIDRHVSKQDQIQADGSRQRRRINILDQIQIGETHPGTHGGHKRVDVTLLAEIAGILVNLGLPERPVPIAGRPRPLQERRVQIGSQNRNPPRTAAAKELIQENGHRVRFFTRATSGTPDPDLPTFRILPQNLWQHVLAQGAEMMLVPEKVRFSDRQTTRHTFQEPGSPIRLNHDLVHVGVGQRTLQNGFDRILQTQKPRAGKIHTGLQLHQLAEGFNLSHLGGSHAAPSTSFDARTATEKR
jgi:hypothetical protein